MIVSHAHHAPLFIGTHRSAYPVDFYETDPQYQDSTGLRLLPQAANHQFTCFELSAITCFI
jgi:hypothetical protein